MRAYHYKDFKKHPGQKETAVAVNQSVAAALCLCFSEAEEQSSSISSHDQRVCRAFVMASTEKGQQSCTRTSTNPDSSCYYGQILT